MNEKTALPKNRKRLRVIVIIVTLLLFAFLCLALLAGVGRNKTVADRAYSWRTRDNCLVYIKENSGFEPYIVLTANYGGNVLLLRKYLLPELMPFNENETHLWGQSQFGGYYENSTIDKYLDTDFINTLSQTSRDAIVDSNIDITNVSIMGVPSVTRTISRKAFLLSLKELGAPKTSASVPEGKTLRYFSDDHTRMGACLPNGEKSAYWTRTPLTWETYMVYIIDSNSGGSLDGADDKIGVRPAFCLKRSAAITQRTDIINGQTVYVIE